VLYFVIKQATEIPAAELHKMYRMRYMVAVDQWGWNIPTAKRGIDKDQFDTRLTTYILVYNRNSEMVACSRLNPTTRPHLMSEIFANQCEFSGVPQGKSIQELSRFVVDASKLTHAQQVQLYLQLCLVVTEYAISIGLKQLTWLTHKTKYIKSVVVWKTRPLGLPQYYPDDDAEYIAAIMDTTDESVRRLRRFCKLDGPIPLSDIPNCNSAQAA